MKKLLFLVACATALISCERGTENVTNESFEKQPIKEHEKNSSKKASDTIIVSNLSPSAGKESSFEVDPKDIQTPPRSTRREEEPEDVDPNDIKTPPRK